MADNQAQQARKKAQDEARKAMEEHREQVAKGNEEAMKRVAESKPTPTQEENDLARLGIHVEKKEDDKSGQTVIEKRVVANEPLPPHGYETRSATPAKKKE